MNENSKPNINIIKGLDLQNLNVFYTFLNTYSDFTKTIFACMIPNKIDVEFDDNKYPFKYKTTKIYG